jgi:hypothetical protein
MSEKVVPAANYSHSAAARTITFSGDYTTLTEENIIKITDLITGDVIYDHPKSHCNCSILDDLFSKKETCRGGIL